VEDQANAGLICSVFRAVNSLDIPSRGQDLSTSASLVPPALTSPHGPDRIVPVTWGNGAASEHEDGALWPNTASIKQHSSCEREIGWPQHKVNAVRVWIQVRDGQLREGPEGLMVENGATGTDRARGHQ
jgi:hypothetical protein